MAGGGADPGWITTLIPSALKMDVSGVPHSLARSEPVVHSWNLRGLSCPWEERGLVTEHALEWSQSGGVLTERILGILGPGEEAAPAVLVVMAV